MRSTMSKKPMASAGTELMARRMLATGRSGGNSARSASVTVSAVSQGTQASSCTRPSGR